MATEQTSISPCCVTGHIHEGTPLGSFQTLHGLRTYVTTPKEPSANTGGKQDTVVFITDIFGPDLNNVKIAADEWAGQGFKVLVPDVFENDPVPHEHLKAIVPNVRDKEKAGLAEKAHSATVMATSLGPWTIKHREAVARPIVEKFFQDVKADPTTGKVVAVGFCWGGRYALLLSNDDSPAKPDVTIAYHPAFLAEADIKNITSVPCAILKGDQDDMLSDDQLDAFEKDLSSRLGDKLLVKRYPNAVHGFAIRGDDMVESEKKQKEDAHDTAISFAKKYL